MSNTYSIKLKHVTPKAIRVTFAMYKQGNFDHFRDEWIPKSQIIDGLEDLPTADEVVSGQEIFEIELSDWFEGKLSITPDTARDFRFNEGDEAPF